LERLVVINRNRWSPSPGTRTFSGDCDFLQILSLTMFERMPIDSMLSRDPIPEPDATLDKQLKLFD
jgi:hypothetical protein